MILSIIYKNLIFFLVSCCKPTNFVLYSDINRQNLNRKNNTTYYY